MFMFSLNHNSASLLTLDLSSALLHNRSLAPRYLCIRDLSGGGRPEEQRGESRNTTSVEVYGIT